MRHFSPSDSIFRFLTVGLLAGLAIGCLSARGADSPRSSEGPGAIAPVLQSAADQTSPHQPRRDAPGGCVLEGSVTVRSTVSLPGVTLALKDLSADLEKVLGSPAKLVTDGKADIVVQLDPSLGRPESYRVDVHSDGVRLTGADELGVIYAIYRVSQDYLGVDPYWYFKDLLPQSRDRIALAAGSIQSKPPTFHYRGWFVNDEDLLTEWKSGGGQRHISYPFYQQVVHLEVIDRVYEALLRAGGNLIIPASFVDVMNEPEARLVARAAERGLYVSQHHIEPLGVSHYGFENYWKARGADHAFAYGSHPDRVRQAWRAFAQRWHDLAGNKVVWQLGLRGKGDRAIWTSDASVDRSQAGRLISQAIAEQWDIVRSVDPRPVPPATTTLWAEGSELMSQGSLTFPKEVIIVFADHGPSQTMQGDFSSTKRESGRRYGVYYHIGFWNAGSHLLQGTTPERIRAEFDRIVAKGDTEYAILNVCNVREHVLGIQVATEIMNDPRGWTEAGFWHRFAPKALHQPYQKLLATFIPLGGKRLLQDGTLFTSAKRKLASYTDTPSGHASQRPAAPVELAGRLTNAIAALDALIAAYPAAVLTSRERPFFDVHYLTQARMMREMYAFYLATMRAADDAGQLTDAQHAIERFLDARQAAANGKWSGWYRGDKKVDVPALLERTRAASRKLLPAAPAPTDRAR